MPSSTTESRRVAFTLVEVIVAMTVFTMVVAGGIIGIQKGFEFVDNSRHYTRSSQILQSELELLRTLPWNTFSALDDSTLTSRFNDQIAQQFGSGTYLGKVVTQRIPAGGDKMRVEVTVEWTARSGRGQQVSYITFFTEGGVNDYFIN